MTATEFLELIIGSLIEDKNQMSITETVDDLGTLLSLQVAPSDMGTIIGKGGKTIESIRTVLRVYGSKTGRRVNLRIIEDKE